MYPQGYICLSKGVHLMLSIEEQNILPYNIYPNIYTYISEYSVQKSFYVYCLIHLWIIMIKCIVIRNFRGTCASVECWRGTYLSVEMLKGYMLICRNAEGVHGKRQVGNPCNVDLSDANESNFWKVHWTG